MFFCGTYGRGEAERSHTSGARECPTGTPRKAADSQTGRGLEFVHGSSSSAPTPRLASSLPVHSVDRSVPVAGAGTSELKLTATIAHAPPGGRRKTTSCFPESGGMSSNAIT